MAAHEVENWLTDGLAADDADAVAVFEAYADAVALGLGSLVQIFDPDQVVIGGGVTAHGDRLLRAIDAAVAVRWRDMTDPTYTLTITLQAALALFVLSVTPAIRRRFGFGYVVYCVALVAIPTLSTEDFMGTGRYLIAAFPAWAVVGTWVAERFRPRAWILVGSAVLMTAMAAAFARSWYLT